MDFSLARMKEYVRGLLEGMKKHVRDLVSTHPWLLGVWAILSVLILAASGLLFLIIPPPSPWSLLLLVVLMLAPSMLYQKKVCFLRLDNFRARRYDIWTETWYYFTNVMYFAFLVGCLLLLLMPFLGEAPLPLWAIGICLLPAVPVYSWLLLSVFVQMPKDVRLWWSFIGCQSLARCALCALDRHKPRDSLRLTRYSLRLLHETLRVTGYSLDVLLRCKSAILVLQRFNGESSEIPLRRLLVVLSDPNGLGDCSKALESYLGALNWPLHLERTRRTGELGLDWYKVIAVVGPILSIAVALYRDQVLNIVQSAYGAVCGLLSYRPLLLLSLALLEIALSYWMIFGELRDVRLHLSDREFFG